MCLCWPYGLGGMRDDEDRDGRDNLGNGLTVEVRSSEREWLLGVELGSRSMDNHRDQRGVSSDTPLFVCLVQ